MLQKLNGTELTICVVFLDSIRGISCYFMMHLGMTKHRYKYWFFWSHNQINNMYMYVFAGQIESKCTYYIDPALEDWQQLNLSVKNLVKELKTFDLPVGKMIWPSRVRDIYCVVAFLLWLCLLFLCELFFFNTHFHSVLQDACVPPQIHTYIHAYTDTYLQTNCMCACVCVCLCAFLRICVIFLVFTCCTSVCHHVHVCGRASVKEIVSKWQRGSRKNDSYVCGLITINSPFDCNWCLNLRSPPPLGRPLVPPSILSF